MRCVGGQCHSAFKKKEYRDDKTVGGGTQCIQIYLMCHGGVYSQYVHIGYTSPMSHTVHVSSADYCDSR